MNVAFLKGVLFARATQAVKRTHITKNPRKPVHNVIYLA